MIRIMDYADVPEGFFEAGADGSNTDVAAAVKAILEDVKRRGDAAVLEYTRKFDKADLQALAVSEAEVEAAMAQTGKDLLAIMEKAAENIRRFHEHQLGGGFRVERGGMVMGQRVRPIERVGIYVPGGTAAYPSTVLMNAIPAKMAGVKRLVMVTPPRQDGSVPPAILAASRIAGVDEVYKIGGAQAVAALAYGTEAVERVYKITGPGNIYVAEAKRLVFGVVDIDMIAGPSDVFVIADESADARLAAADMLAQAEHDALAQAVLATTDRAFARAVARKIDEQLAELPREDIARKAIEGGSAIIIVNDTAQAAALANQAAPEHLELCVKDPWALLELIENAGSIFLGHNTPEALGDYYAGPNHTLPTMGTARFSNPLSVDDFVKKSQYLCYDKASLAACAKDVAAFARAEGLEAHARSAEMRGSL